jgi:hypothetical protein
MSDQSQPATPQPASPQPTQPVAAQPNQRSLLHEALHRFGGFYHRFHKPDHTKPRKHQSLAYGLAIAIGVPLMALLLRDHFYTKVAIMWCWLFFVPSYYLWSQGAEIDSQIKRFGLLDQEESDSQRRAMYLPLFGLFFALTVYVIGLAVYITANWPNAVWWTNARFVLESVFYTPIYYGLVEWTILLRTLVNAYESIDEFYPIISTILGLSGRIRRIEQGTVTVEPAGH